MQLVSIVTLICLICHALPEKQVGRFQACSQEVKVMIRQQGAPAVLNTIVMQICSASKSSWPRLCLVIFCTSAQAPLYV